MHRSLIFAVTTLSWLSLSSCASIGLTGPEPPSQPIAQVQPPSQLYDQLFEDVQMQRIFPDSKTFPDAVAKDDPRAIVQRYDVEKVQPDFDLAAFVKENFIIPGPAENTYQSIPGQD